MYRAYYLDNTYQEFNNKDMLTKYLRKNNLGKTNIDNIINNLYTRRAALLSIKDSLFVIDTRYPRLAIEYIHEFISIKYLYLNKAYAALLSDFREENINKILNV